MGYWKHRFDGMTPEEQERLDHAELLQYTASHTCPPNAPCVGVALRKYHDRLYGEAVRCQWCQEPQREADARNLDGIAAAFARESAVPQAVPPKAAKPAPSATGERFTMNAFTAGVLDQMMRETFHALLRPDNAHHPNTESPKEKDDNL